MSRSDNTSVRDFVTTRLQRIANVLLINASFIENPGLQNGKMGIAIFFYHYSKYSKNKIYEEYAGELIDEIYGEINTSTPVNFESGLTGIGWGIEYLVKNKFVQGDTDEALSEIDNSVYRNSLYRPFLLESGNDLFGFGLYYLTRLNKHGNDDNNLNTLFKKQHLIYLIDDCERILIQKKYLDFKIQSLSIDTINSFSWFLLEMNHWGIFPFKVEKLFHSLPEYFESHLQNTNDPAGVAQLIKLMESINPCIRGIQTQDSYKTILNKRDGNRKVSEASDEELVNNYIKENWQNLIYEPYIPDCESNLGKANQLFDIIGNEENWYKRIDNLNKNNLGLTGLAGLGLGLLSPKLLTDERVSVAQSTEHRAQRQSTGQNSAIATGNISK